MAKKKGARQQKKVAKQKAKRAAKRTDLRRKSSLDPAIRLKKAEAWPVVEALVSESLWTEGIGPLVIARREGGLGFVWAVYLLDVFCLGVKDTWWDAGPSGSYKEVKERLAENGPLAEIAPACLVKLLEGGIAYAKAIGASPHPDYRHSSRLLAGIDATACSTEYEYGDGGKPHYIRGPNESLPMALAIAERVKAAGGEATLALSERAFDKFVDLDDDSPEDDDYDDEEWEDDVELDEEDEVDDIVLSPESFRIVKPEEEKAPES